MRRRGSGDSWRMAEALGLGEWRSFLSWEPGEDWAGCGVHKCCLDTVCHTGGPLNRETKETTEDTGRGEAASHCHTDAT